MTDILCSWLNDEIGISAVVRRDNFASTLQNGYHFAEVFYKYGFQIDLDLFSARKHDDVLVRNYSMLRPAFGKIGVEITPWKVAQYKKHNQREIRNLAYDLFVGMRRFVKQQEGPSKSQLVYTSIEKLSTPAGPKMMPLDLSELPGSADPSNQPGIMTSIVGSTPNLAAYRKKKKTSKFSIAEFELEKNQALKDIDDFEMAKSEAVKGKKEILPAIEYMNQIKKKAEDARVIGKRRAERRRRVLVDSIQNVFDDNSRARDIQLVERVSRVSILERRLTADLVATKEKEKQILRDNRIRMNKEFEEQRQQQFMTFLDAEAEHLRVQKLEEREQANKEIEEHKRRLQEKREAKHAKNVEYAKTITSDILDIAMTISFYNAGTNKKVPKKIIRELREKFHAQVPIEEDDEDLNCEFALEEYNKFESQKDPWNLQEPFKMPVVDKMKLDISEILKPEETPEPEPEPIWPLRIAVLGKPLSEHDSFVEKFSQNHPVVVRKFVDMVKDCMEAYENEETVTHHLTENEAKGTFEVISSSTTSTNPSRAQSSMAVQQNEEKTEENVDQKYETPSDRAKLGKRISETLAEGGSIDDETVALIAVDEARRIQKSSGFIFVDFPKNATQLEIFEKELTSLQSIILIEKEDETIIKENVASADVAADVSLDISAFEEKWTEMKEMRRNCKNILNSGDFQLTYDNFEQEILEIMSSEKEPEPIVQPEPVTQPEPGQKPEPVTPEPVPEETRSRPTSSKKNSRKGSAKSKDRKGSAQSSRPSSKGSKGSSKKSKKGKEKKEEIPVGPVPGDADYQWLSILDDKSDKTKGFYYRLTQSENDIVNATKKRLLKSFKNIDMERREIVRYLAAIIEDFPKFLNRPDPKQAYIEQFQADFNNQPADLRDDNELKQELHEQLEELTEQLYQVGDTRREENDQERVKLMTSNWLKERLALVIMHFAAMLKTLVLQCAVNVMIMRKHFAFQANAPIDSPSMIKEIAPTKAIEKCEFDLSIETGEPMEGESVVDRSSLASSVKTIMSTVLANLEEIFQSETKAIDEISLEKPEAEAPKKDDKKRGKSPKGGKKSPAGKGGKKGAKESPVGTSPEPDLKLERLLKAKNEAKCGIIELVEFAKAKLQVISRNLDEMTESSILQFEACFGRMADMISIAQANETSAVEEANSFIKAAIENASPLRNALNFGPSFEMIDEVEILVAESTAEEEMITVTPAIEIVVKELIKLNSYDLSEEQMHQVAKDLNVKKELIEEADGDWRVLALYAVASEEESGIISKAVAEGSNSITLEEWTTLLSETSPLCKIGQLLVEEEGLIPLDEIERILHV
ncbi:Oidioi.mRNA.OKI2018_I69.chr2.g4744.t1.cds [Oikopleura dioica]|uniref:Oidioi.mRNA.OKI2018_I69.chr2.g4744.t1.cds n=1 Tax=Oikopleura dioica TaxID=34765 RepID=A0ABN7T4V5_OIKDI|nr:Oidioi.mRNA.OKI2018_I69.chr2.g4744.t1.cds [Oikopleura dioica]